jgi:hypothetical protein
MGAAHSRVMHVESGLRANDVHLVCRIHFRAMYVCGSEDSMSALLAYVQGLHLCNVCALMGCFNTSTGFFY